MVKIKCPCKKPHTKRRDDLAVKEQCCDAFVSLVKVVEGTEMVYKCRNCKNLLHLHVANGIVHLTILDRHTKVTFEQGKVIVDALPEACA